jgi:isoamylase
MAQENWGSEAAHSLGMLIHGEATDETDDRGRPIHGDTMLLLVNAGPDDVPFTLPAVAGENRDVDADRRAGVWTTLIDTARYEPRRIADARVDLAPYSMLLLRFGRERRLSAAAGGPGSAAEVNAAAVSAAGESAPVLATTGAAEG